MNDNRLNTLTILNIEDFDRSNRPLKLPSFAHIILNVPTGKSRPADVTQ